ncbi:TetR/AcrR family transcriptional regulator [Acaryochloris marina]|uniref:Transcriptional regulator, TetR family n=1 Tax=Acaryochloris marina (strain MBIC 11017) TaxID=329726 RepID=A8ZLZ2_ACAM1|nr:TetR/AcrR family transcriptional regulator [Acaryochloris marina]ABW31761.1 transcriptional regulator, TetR family [Acaryochloris marina MBIC11017]BDM83040.1 TetR family transcriptional regulator [Acaryochloris marina MBIC10699]
MARPKRNEHIREQLLDQGLKLFLTQGYHGTGIKEILDQINVPKGSFYNYFESKEQFGAEVIRHFTKGVIANMSACLHDPEDDAITALQHFFEQEMHRHEDLKAGCMLGNLGAELGGSSQLCQQAMIEGFQGMKQQFSFTLQRGQSQGKIRDDIDIEELADFLVNAYEGALLRMQVEQSVQPIQQLSLLLNSYLAKT